jgi:leukotriene-A4 hydrolase
MKKNTNFFLYFLCIPVIFIASCSKLTDRSLFQSESDYFTLSNYYDVAVNHLDLDLSVDFRTKIISGKATLKFTNPGKSDRIILDTRNLNIIKAHLDSANEDAGFSLAKLDSLRGQALTIYIKPETKSVTIEYSTTPENGAVQWLDPEQTEGKVKPFLFTQSQSILARTWIPCQDCPSIRMTYHARIKTDPELLVLMSAVNNPKEKNSKGIYEFDMPLPIPSYLMAMAIGDIEYRSISGRSGVYAEKSNIEKVAWELGDIEKMIKICESLYGPYKWERYDAIVLPPSFPFGGMENPCLTFATPTIITGDKSLVSLIAHELAHSWSGNLVTNATWDDFWLNEGFTVYFEYRITEALYGREFSEMLAQITYEDLSKEVQELGEKSPDTRLKVDLAGRDIEEAPSDIAYNKGYFFLRMIEETIGREKFDNFLEKYFHENAFHSMTTRGFINIFNRDIIKGNPYLRDKLNIEKWIYSTGIPDNCPKVESAELKKVDVILAEWNEGKALDTKDYSKWTTHHYIHFIRNLPKNINPMQMKDLDKVFNFTQSTNAEILEPWLELAIDNNYTDAFPSMEKFMMKVGRRRFIRPLYEKLCNTSAGKSMAMGIYTKAKPMYHSILKNSVDILLKDNGKTE